MLMWQIIYKSKHRYQGEGMARGDLFSVLEALAERNISSLRSFCSGYRGLFSVIHFFRSMIPFLFVFNLGSYQFTFTKVLGGILRIPMAGSMASGLWKTTSG